MQAHGQSAILPLYGDRGELDLLGRPCARGNQPDEEDEFGEGEEQRRCAEALSRRGYEIALVSGVPRRALGNPVKALDAADGTRIRCDAVAIALPPAPLHELASSVGAQAHFDGNGFPVQTDEEGRTSVPWLFAAGTVANQPGAASGEIAGRAAWR